MNKLRLNIVLIFILTFSTGRAQNMQSVLIPETVYYSLLNKVFMDHRIKRVYNIPYPYFENLSDSFRYPIYQKENALQETHWVSDSNMSVVDHFLYRVKNNDTSTYYFNEADYLFMKFQIIHPTIKRYSRSKIVNSKVKRWLTLGTDPVSPPLFSMNLQSAIISLHYWGMSRTYLSI
jgi:hypothetical protein